MTQYFQYSQDTTLSQIKYLIDNGFDINTKNELGYTLLHNACIYNHNEIVKFLLRHNAKINIYNNNNECPIDYARINNNTHLMILLYKSIYQSNLKGI